MAAPRARLAVRRWSLGAPLTRVGEGWVGCLCRGHRRSCYGGLGDWAVEGARMSREGVVTTVPKRRVGEGLRC